MPRSKLYRPQIDQGIGLDVLGIEFYTNSNVFESFYVINIGPQALANLTLKLTANFQGQQFASFHYQGMFFNKGSGSELRNGFNAISTDKTQIDFDCRARLIGNLVLLQAKSFTPQATHWEMILQKSDLAP